MAQEVVYLGHSVSGKELQLLEEKIKDIKKAPVPKIASELKADVPSSFKLLWMILSKSVNDACLPSRTARKWRSVTLG